MIALFWFYFLSLWTVDSLCLGKSWYTSHAINIAQVMDIVNGRIKIQWAHWIDQPFGFIDSFVFPCNVCSTADAMSFQLTKYIVEFWFPLWICAKKLRREPCFHTTPMNRWKWILSHDNKLTHCYTINKNAPFWCVSLYHHTIFYWRKTWGYLTNSAITLWWHFFGWS